MTRRVKIEESRDAISIEYRWFEPTIMTVAIAPLALIGVAALFIAAATNPESDPTVLILFIPVWMIFIYVYLAKLTNRTFIKIDKDLIRVYSAPLPWPGRKRFARKSVRGVFARERVETSSMRDGNSTSVTGEILAYISGTETPIVRGLSDVIIAHEIAAAMNRLLRADSE